MFDRAGESFAPGAGKIGNGLVQDQGGSGDEELFGAAPGQGDCILDMASWGRIRGFFEVGREGRLEGPLQIAISMYKWSVYSDGAVCARCYLAGQLVQGDSF